MMNISVFSWNIQTYNVRKSKDSLGPISKTIIDAMIPEIISGQPFLGFLLEVKARNEDEAKFLLEGFKSKIKLKDLEVSGGVIDIGGTAYTHEWIIYLYSGVELKAENLDVKTFLAHKINIQNVKSYNGWNSNNRNASLSRQMAAADILLRKNRELDEVLSGKKKRLNPENYEIDYAGYQTAVDKLPQIAQGAEEEYNPDKFQDWDGALEFVKNEQWAGEKEIDVIRKASDALDKDPYSASVLDSVTKTILNRSKFNEDEGWYRSGALITVVVGNRHAVRIASAHLPGPTHSKYVEIIRAYLNAAFLKDADFLIGDLNVYGKIAHVGFWEQSNDVRYTTVRNVVRDFSHGALDRILTNKWSLWERVGGLETYEPPPKPVTQLENDKKRNARKRKGKQKTVSDHYLLKAVIAPKPAST